MPVAPGTRLDACGTRDQALPCLWHPGPGRLPVAPGTRPFPLSAILLHMCLCFVGQLGLSLTALVLCAWLSPAPPSCRLGLAHLSCSFQLSFGQWTSTSLSSQVLRCPLHPHPPSAFTCVHGSVSFPFLCLCFSEVHCCGTPSAIVPMGKDMVDHTTSCLHILHCFCSACSGHVPDLKVARDP